MRGCSVFKWFKSAMKTERWRQPWTAREAEAVLSYGSFDIDLNDLDLTCRIGVDDETARGLPHFQEAASSGEDLNVYLDPDEIDWGGNISLSWQGIEQRTGRLAQGFLYYECPEDAIESATKWGGVGEVQFSQGAFEKAYFLNINFLTTSRMILQDLCTLLQFQALSKKRPTLTFYLSAPAIGTRYSAMDNVPTGGVPLKALSANANYAFSDVVTKSDFRP